MAGNSRAVLFVGGFAIILSIALISTQQGDGFLKPMTTIFILSLAFLLFMSMSKSEKISDGSTPIRTDISSSNISIEGTSEDLPDPEESGFDIPIL